MLSLTIHPDEKHGEKIHLFDTKGNIGSVSIHQVRGDKVSITFDMPGVKIVRQKILDSVGGDHTKVGFKGKEPLR